MSEDAPDLALPTRGSEYPIDVGLCNYDVERARERFRLRPRSEHPAGTVEFLLVELNMLVP